MGVGWGDTPGVCESDCGGGVGVIHLESVSQLVGGGGVIHLESVSQLVGWRGGYTWSL